MDINSIIDPKFIKELNIDELNKLSTDIRTFLLDNVSKTGGHLSSNLGIVELTIALHYVFNSPSDKFVFDVGHQSYVHKILTGRASKFNTLRQYQGLSGFQKRYESEHDVWEAGHSSTAVSSAIGMAVARDFNKAKNEIIAIVGDAAMTSGETFEALNYLGELDTKVIVVLNDNSMSISKNVGGFSKILSSIRLSNSYSKTKTLYTNILEQSNFGKKIFNKTKELKDQIKTNVLPDNLFSQFGLDYIGPIDGHSLDDLINCFKYAKTLNRSVVIHVKTIKGKGYIPAEKDHEGIYHGVNPFDINKGIIKENKTTYSSIISDFIEDQMKYDKNIVCVTPAMITGSNLNHLFKQYPERCFDVGIAEDHAMTFAAGMSINGLKPYIVIYSSFLQRCYDQINHDIARMNLPVLIGVDHAGLVGHDGETHHGVFDIGFLLPIPNLIIMSPANAYELKSMVYTAFRHFDKPYVIRFPKAQLEDQSFDNKEITIGSWNSINYSDKHTLTIISYGENIEKIKQLIDENDYPVDLINARFFKPMDYNLLDKVKSKKIIVYETDLKQNGLGQNIISYYNENNIKNCIDIMGIGDHYTPQGDNDELLQLENISIDDLRKKIENLL